MGRHVVWGTICCSDRCVLLFGDGGIVFGKMFFRIRIVYIEPCGVHNYAMKVLFCNYFD